MKKFFTFTILLILTCALWISAAAAESVEIKMTIGDPNGYVNGEAKTLDAAPIIRHDRTMLPVRFVAENLGASVSWDGATSTATVTSGETEIKITIGAETAVINGEAKTLDAPAFIENSRTYLPVRFVAEALGASVSWDGATSTAIITAGVSDTDGKAILTKLSALNTHIEENSHAKADTPAYIEADMRSLIELSSATTGQARYDKAQYPRIKQKNDGSYIMFWQYGSFGPHIYYSFSNDLVHWEAPQVLYNASQYKFPCDYTDTGTDTTYFVNCDAEVLSNGDILTVVSYRANKGYLNHPELAGIYLRRSTNGGRSWGEPQSIYTGVNWEPSIQELSNGEIQVYFTQVSPGIEYWGAKTDRNSTGTAMVCSTDGGYTWLPEVSAAPWQARLIFQQYVLDVEGSPSFTDQMSVGTELYDGTLAVVCESKMPDKNFRISVIHSDAAWSETVAFDQTGPSDRQDNMFSGAGPYIVKMPTGETVLAYGKNSRSMVLRVGDGDARSFGEEVTVFRYPGYWGAIEVTGNNRLTAVFPVSGTKNLILLENLYLNHAIQAPRKSIVTDGKNSLDWADIKEALFIGSSSQAQASVRAAHNGSRLYLLVERRDESLTEQDASFIYIADTAGKYYRFRIDASGDVILEYGAGKAYEAVASGFTYASSVISGKEGGIVTEIEADMAALGISGRRGLKINLMLNNADADGTMAQDILEGLDAYDASTWLDLMFEDGGSADSLAPGKAAAHAVADPPEKDSEMPQALYVFDKSDSISGLFTDENELEVSFHSADHCVNLSITDSHDPFVTLRYGSLNADSHKYMLIRARAHSSGAVPPSIGFYFCAGDMAEMAYSEAAQYTLDIEDDGEWHTYLVDFSAFSLYSGTLKSMRLDPFNSAQAPIHDGVDIAWIAFSDDLFEAMNYVN